MEWEDLSEEDKDYFRGQLDEYINELLQDPQFQMRLMLEMCIKQEREQRRKDIMRIIKEDRELCKEIFIEEFGGVI